MGFLAGNAIVAGVTAGIERRVADGDFWPAFRAGMVGGALAYAGRRIAAEEFDAAGLIGREVGAVGASLVRNAADGRAPLARIVLPAGLVRIHIERDSASRLPRIRTELDLPTIVAVGYYIARDDMRFDMGTSLSAGAAVFYSHDRGADGNWSGDQFAGAIRIRGNPADPLPDFSRAEALAHERTHVLQYDFSAHLWGAPLERWLARRYGGRALERHVDVGLQLVPWALANLLVPYDARPWEIEAGFLSGSDSDPD